MCAKTTDEKLGVDVQQLYAAQLFANRWTKLTLNHFLGDVVRNGKLLPDGRQSREQ